MYSPFNGLINNPPSPVNGTGSYPQYSIPQQTAMPFQMPSYRPNTSLASVNGLEGAKAYPTKPNDQIALFDLNDDVFYLKSTDAGNFASIRAFRFTEVKEDETSPKYVTMEEFNQFKEEMLNGKQSIQSSKSGKWSSKQSSAGKGHDGYAKKQQQSTGDVSDYADAESTDAAGYDLG